MTSISTNMYIDKLADIFHRYNNTYHKTIKMKPINVTSSTHIKFGVENNDNNDFLVMSEYRNMEILLQKLTLQIGLKMFL